MSQAKASAKKASPSKKGEAARAEKKDGPATFDFRGLELVLPKKLPLSFAFKWRQVQKDRNGDQFAILDVIETLLGAEQFAAIERQIDEEGLTIDDDAQVLVDLIEGVIEAFGVSLGESTASA